MADLMSWLYQVVNGPSHPGAVGLPPSKVTPPPPAVPKDTGTQHSWRDVLLEKGPEGWAKDIRAHSGLLLTDTTWYAPQLSSAHEASQICHHCLATACGGFHYSERPFLCLVAIAVQIPAKHSSCTRRKSCKASEAS